MMFPLEPGPCELIRDDQIPRPRLQTRTFESLAAPVSAQLSIVRDTIGEQNTELIEASDHDVDGEFASTVAQAAGEVGAQLGSQSEVDPGPMFAGALEVLDEANQMAGDLPSEGATAGVVRVPGEDDPTEFDVARWRSVDDPPDPPPPPPPPPPDLAADEPPLE